MTTNRHADAVVNVFEAQARAVRVARIVAVIPISTDADKSAWMLRRLEAATLEERAAFALKYAGLKRPPSDTTWALVVEAVRARIAPANQNAGGQ